MRHFEVPATVMLGGTAFNYEAATITTQGFAVLIDSEGLAEFAREAKGKVVKLKITVMFSYHQRLPEIAGRVYEATLRNIDRTSDRVYQVRFDYNFANAGEKDEYTRVVALSAVP
jgi:hypothetical protein